MTHLTTARNNVAARHRAAGRDRDADAVLAGPDGWAVRHEVLRLEREMNEYIAREGLDR